MPSCANGGAQTKSPAEAGPVKKEKSNETGRQFHLLPGKIEAPWSVIRFPGQGAPDDVLEGGRPLWRGSLGGQRRWLIDQIGGKVSLGLLSQPGRARYRE
jgi:hypothetical protein